MTVALLKSVNNFMLRLSNFYESVTTVAVSTTKGVIMSTEWMADGKCRDYPDGTFFPRDGIGVIKAQKICATCPVIGQCLEYALENHVDHGVWGATSERERRRLQRTRRRLTLPGQQH